MQTTNSSLDKVPQKAATRPALMQATFETDQDDKRSQCRIRQLLNAYLLGTDLGVIGRARDVSEADEAHKAQRKVRTRGRQRCTLSTSK